jgi:hypothetical protein
MALGSARPLTEMSTRDLPGGVKCGRPLRLTPSPPSMSLLPRRCAILDVSQTYGPPRPFTLPVYHPIILSYIIGPTLDMV